MTEPTTIPITRESLPEPTHLTFSIYASSGHTASYVPSHIFVDNPCDQSSRWTGGVPGGTSETEDVRKSSASRLSRTTGTGAGAATSTSMSMSASGSGLGQSKKKETQFLTLQLDKPSLVTVVGFGKYHRVHPCNLAEFSIYGGLSPNPKHMDLLYHGGLKNDTLKERIELAVGEASDKAGGEILLPVKYLRIDALAAHSQNYNVSIWHMWLEGHSSPALMDQLLATYESYRALKSSHLILAHLRRSNLLSPYHTMLSSLSPAISTTFEHPLLSALHTSLVINGRFSPPSLRSPLSKVHHPLDAESLLEECLASNLFRQWTTGGGKGKSVARWEQLSGGGGSSEPCPRGGHQMVRMGRKLFLFGGWDGQEELADLWELDLPRGTYDTSSIGQWRNIENGLEGDRGIGGDRPRGRSCHQMAADESQGWIYLLGGLKPSEESPPTSSSSEGSPVRIHPANIGANGSGPVSMESSAPVSMEVEEDESQARLRSIAKVEANTAWANDFWRYKAVGASKGTWECLSADVSQEGGPKLLFDHGMVVHSEAGQLFVYGGKDSRRENRLDEWIGSEYSGMFVYDIAARKWTCLFGDPSPSSEGSDSLLSRIGLTVLLDPKAPSLYVLGGQRGTNYFSDLWSIQLPQIAETSTSPSGLDFKLWRESLSLLTSSPANEKRPLIERLSADYSHDGPPAGFTQRTSIDVETGEWTMLSGLTVEKRSTTESCSNEVWVRNRAGVWESVERRGNSPPGRFAAQVAYDPLRRDHYLMGGNPEDTLKDSVRPKRLGDLWRLHVDKPSPQEALRQAKFLIRKQRFKEMCQTHSTLTALTYLQTTLSSVVDHTNESEASAFRACMSSLLAAPASNNRDELTEEGEHTDSPGDDDTMAASMSSADFSQSESQRLSPIGISSALYSERHALFEQLLGFFPASDCQPSEDLRDLAVRRDQIGEGYLD